MGNVKRFSLYILIICLTIPMIATPTYAEEFNYHDYSTNHTYPTEALEQLIEVYSYEEQYDAEEVQKMIDRLDVIPKNIIEESVLYGARLVFIDFTIPEFEEFSHLAGEQPRGHAEDITWEDMFGIASGPLAVSTIGYTFPKGYQGSVQLDYHELFHVVDYIMLGTTITELEEFRAIHEIEQYDLDPYNDYYEYIDEYFAEAAAYYYRGADYRSQLQNRTPQTYTFFTELHERIISITDYSGEQIRLTWPHDEAVAHYVVYRDDEKIGEATESDFTDQTFESFREHEYRVEGMDSNGDITFESLPRIVWTEANTSLTINEHAQVTLMSATENEITFEWEPVDHAINYKIYRDGTYIGTTDEAMYQDFVYASDRTFTYIVRAMNETDDYVEFAPFTASTLAKDAETTLGTDSNQEEQNYFSPTDDSANNIPITFIVIALGVLFFFFLLFVAAIIILIYFLIKRKEKKQEENN